MPSAFKFIPLLLALLCACSREGSITGTLLAPDGTPATGSVQATGQDTRRGFNSKANPSFTMTGLIWDTYSMRVKSPDGWLALDPVKLQAGDELDLGDIKLLPFGSIHGTTPRQLAGRDLQVVVSKGKHPDGLSFPTSEAVDAEGTFSARDLPGGEYRIKLQDFTEEERYSPSKLGIEAVVVVQPGKQTEVVMAPATDSILLRGKVQKKGQPLGNEIIWLVIPAIEDLEDAIIRNVRTDSEGRFLVWLDPNDVFWVIAPLDGDRATLAKERHAPQDGKEITWEVPTTNLVVNMVDATGEPIEFIATISGSAGASLTPQACDFHASSARSFVGTQVRFEHLTPGTKYTIFAAGEDSERGGWISIPGQTFTCPEQGESHWLDLVLKPISD